MMRYQLIGNEGWSHNIFIRYDDGSGECFKEYAQDRAFARVSASGQWSTHCDDNEWVKVNRDQGYIFPVRLWLTVPTR